MKLEGKISINYNLDRDCGSIENGDICINFFTFDERKSSIHARGKDDAKIILERVHKLERIYNDFVASLRGKI